MTEDRRPIGSRAGEPRLVTAPPAARLSRRQRFALTLAAAAAAFVIVFQFLALQLQGGRDPALGALAAPIHSTSASATAGSAPLVTRTSGGAQAMPVARRQPGVSSITGTAHGSAHKVITTRTSAPGARSAEADE